MSDTPPPRPPGAGTPTPEPALPDPATHRRRRQLSGLLRHGVTTHARQAGEEQPATPVKVGRGRQVYVPVEGQHVTVHFDRASLWRAGWVVIALITCLAILRFVLQDGGSVIFTLVFSFLLSIAMEPAVSRLARHMRRGLATAIVLFGTIALGIIFLVTFGRLLAEQITTFVEAVPALATAALDWISNRFHVTLNYDTILQRLGIGTSALTTIAQNLAGGAIGFIFSVFSAAFGTLTTIFFTYYLSADGPRLRRWIASIFPPRQQEVFATAWELAVIKTGGYVSARLVLAAICGGTAAAFMAAIGMPYWLPLGIWTGVVAQFVPTIGTYIAIALPVLVGLMGGEPWKGLAMLAFALVYQQIENVTIEPRISAQAVDVHPAFSFAAVMFGASLFGVAGAFVAVPVSALLLAMFEIYLHKYDLLPQIAAPAPGEELDEHDEDEQAQAIAELATEASKRSGATVTTDEVARHVGTRAQPPA